MRYADAAPEKVHAAEASISGIRVAVILLNSVAYAVFMDPAGTYPTLAWSIIVLANAYGIGYHFLRPYRRFPVLMSSYFSTFTDAAFITLWIFATGGFDSPFYLLWLLSIVAVAFRYDMRETMLAAAVYAASYVALLAFTGQLVPHAWEVALRVGYLGLTATLGGLLGRELESQTREKVEMRTLALALRESEERFRRLSDATFEGIAVHEKGVIVEANASFARMFGGRVEDVVGHRVETFVDPVSLPAVAARLQTPDDAPYEILARRLDGATFDAEVTARDLPWEGRHARVVAVRDITERKKAERAVREREVLSMQNERLREMDTMKTQFINNAAHELGTPLTPIKLQAHLLRLGGLGDLNDRQRRAVDVLTRNVDHLGLMVKDLLDASRIQSRDLKLARQEIDLDRVLREATESFANDASGIEVRYDGKPGLVVHADAARLTQVVFNLVGNALRFTPKGGRIVVRARRTGGEAHVEVEDNGVGIAPQDLPRLFQPFSQVHDTTQESRSGAGLGLFISKGIVESHGGRIWAESAGRGKGTTFHVALPLSRKLEAEA